MTLTSFDEPGGDGRAVAVRQPAIREEVTMRVFAALAAAVFVLWMSGPAHAGTIASPTIYGGGFETSAECALRNVGRTLVSVDVKLVTESGTPLVLNGQSCNDSSQPVGSPCHLVPGGIFTVRADITAGFAYACSASGNVSNLRGTLIVGPSGGVAIRSAELR
jgi:hypothetical protein